MPHPDLKVLENLCRQETKGEAYPLAGGISRRVPLYSGSNLHSRLQDQPIREQLRAEWRQVLNTGPGVFVIQEAYSDTEVIDAMTTCFREIIAREKASGENRGDHFGKNERIWNSIQKTAVAAPKLFADYYGNPFLALACEAWLGPGYQLTAQVNIVKPGSPAQSAHRDYHLGFQSDEITAQFPLHAQIMSQFLTLQGAIAHTDMSVASGPTQLLPYSQQLESGYQRFRDPDFVTFFERQAIQLPLNKGDLLFFNPALFHAAGTNKETSDRIANLIQISSAFGRTMESLDPIAIITAIYPELLQRFQNGNLSETQLNDTIAAAASGYSFPTNLDADPPVNGNAPRTQQSYLNEAVTQAWPWPKLHETLKALNQRRKP